MTGLRLSSSQTPSGIGYMMVGILSFAAMDAAGKWVVRDYSVFQLLAIRSGLAALILLLLAPLLGGRGSMRTRQPLAHLIRSSCSVLAFLFFFASVRVLPLADAVAVAFGGPFIVTALSVPVLGERVDKGRWLAVGVGFLGMLLIVRPTAAAFQPASLLVIASSVCYAMMMVLTRWMSARSESGEKTFAFLAYTFLLQFAVGAAFALPVWKEMGGVDLALSCAVGILALGGHFGITAAFQRAPASVVAPFEYTALVWATIFGYSFYRDFPALPVWLGVGVIVGAGLYTLHRESTGSEVSREPVLHQSAGDGNG